MSRLSKKQAIILVVSVSLFFSSYNFGLAMSQDEARKKLQEQYTPYQSDFINFNYFLGAMLMGKMNVAQLWIDAGFNVNTKNSFGQSALMVLVSSQNKSATQQLLSFKPDPNVKDNNGVTALMMAVNLNNIDLVNVLMDYGANVNEKTNKGGNALFYAVNNGNTVIVERLIAAGIEINVKNTDGVTPLSLAKESGRTEIVTLLRSKMGNNPTNRLPQDYPTIKTKTSLILLNDQTIEQAKREALKEKKVSLGYALGYKMYYDDLLSKALIGVANGKLTLYYWLETPYSAIKYEFFKANKQFKPVDNEAVNRWVENKNFASIIITSEDMYETNEFERQSGYIANKQEAVIANVVIRQNGIVYQCVANEGNIWRFPIDLFSAEGDIEIIVVDTDNVQKILKVSGNTISKFK